MQAGGQMATINDETFVQGIQFLIEEGILKVPQPYVRVILLLVLSLHAWYN